ncbi:hypothetical protein ACHAW5_006880 [Stephanodiscus triporus]|uniref:Uncharacterized protein n=1 Tax=Stephanodiscus triporus TaxID=2934178 RepID=A0ABD3MW73_9STRA
MSEKENSSSLGVPAIVVQSSFSRQDTNDDSLVGLAVIPSDGVDLVDGVDVAAAAFAAATVECVEDGEDVGALGIAGSSSTIDLDAHLTYEERVLGVPKVDVGGDDRVVVSEHEAGGETTSFQTPIESIAEAEEAEGGGWEGSGATMTTTHGGYASRYLVGGRGSCPITVTPTENGDVILLTPMEEMMDVGPQPRPQSPRNAQAVGRGGAVEKNDDVPAMRERPKSSPAAAAASLLIPSLGANEEWSSGRREGEERGADDAVAPSKPTYGRRKTTNATEESPTGVDELEDFEEDQGSQDSDDFYACDDWYGKDNCKLNDDSAALSSQPFGLIKIHDSAPRDIRICEEQSTQSVIELRHSMESDCGQSQSSSSLDADLVDHGQPSMREETSRTQPGTSVNESSNEEEETRVSLGLDEATEDEDSERDAPGDYFDSSYGVDSVEVKGGEIPDFINDIIEREYSLGRSGASRPWVKHDCGVESDSCGEDIVTVPSESSMLSLGNVREHSSVSQASSVPEVLPLDSVELSLAKENFDDLRKFWVQDRREMATTAGPSSGKVVSEDKPRFLLREEVGDAMESVSGSSTSTSPYVAAPESNICTDRDGNKYLRIFDLNTGDNIYEVIQQRSYDLETVDEISSEESEEEEGEGKNVEQSHDGTVSKLLDTLLEKTVESEARTVAGPNQAIASLEDLYNLFDEYQGTLQRVENCNQTASQTPDVQSPPAGLEIRCVKSSKKSRIHLKKRAIVKAKSAKSKYDLFDIDRASCLEGKSHQRVLSKEKSGGGADDASQFNIEDYEESTTIGTPKECRLVERKCLYASIAKKKMTDNPSDPIKEEMNYHHLDSTNDDSSSAQSSVPSESVNTFTSEPTTHDELLKNATKGESLSIFIPSVALSSESSESFVSDDKTSDKTQLSLRQSPEPPERKSGSTSMLTKLYEENAELAETLANTQRELAVTQWKLNLFDNFSYSLEDFSHPQEELYNV